MRNDENKNLQTFHKFLSLTYVQLPQVAESAATHAPVDDQARVQTVFVRVTHARV